MPNKSPSNPPIFRSNFTPFHVESGDFRSPSYKKRDQIYNLTIFYKQFLIFFFKALNFLWKLVRDWVKLPLLGMPLMTYTTHVRSPVYIFLYFIREMTVQFFLLLLMLLKTQQKRIRQ